MMVQIEPGITKKEKTTMESIHTDFDFKKTMKDRKDIHHLFLLRAQETEQIIDLITNKAKELKLLEGQIRIGVDLLCSTLAVHLYGCLEPEEAIEHFCGPIHREYNVDWKLVPYYKEVDYITEIKVSDVSESSPLDYYKKLTLRVEVYLKADSICTIKEEVLRVRSDEELEKYFRTEKKYSFHCAD